MKAITTGGETIECIEVEEADHGLVLYDGERRQVGYVPYERLDRVASTRRPVSSTSIRSVGYDEGTETLEIEFQSGGVYEYYGVPERVHAELLTASSRGGYFHDNVRGEYDYARLL
jgi:hypothetical protein